MTEAIAELVPRQRELESHVERCCQDNHIQLLQRLDNQCRAHILVSKRRILGLALTPKKPNPELSVSISNFGVKYFSAYFILDSVLDKIFNMCT